MSIDPDLFGTMFSFDSGIAPVLAGLVASGCVTLSPSKPIFIGISPPGEESA
jgi:hypothetical protein